MRPSLRLAAALLAALLWTSPAGAAGPTLNRVDVAGGRRTVVARGPADSDGWSSIRWTPDGRALLAVSSGRRGLAVRRYPVAGGRARLVRNLGDALDGVLSRDGTLVAARYDSRHGLRGGRGGLIVSELATGRIRARMPQNAEGDELYESGLEVAWSRDGARLAYLSQERGHGRTLRIADARSGRVLRRIAARDIYGISADAFSPAGDRLAYPSGGRGHLTLLDVATGAVRKPGVDLFSVSWAPAGERLAASTGGKVMVSGEDRRFGTPQAAGESVPVVRWSPDGTALALLLENDLTDYRTAIAVMPLVPGPGRPRILVPYSERGVGVPQWSPDGRRIAYAG